MYNSSESHVDAVTITHNANKNNFESILQWYRRHRHPIQVVVAPTADAAAASHVILELFRTNLVLFDVHCVFYFDELRGIANKMLVDIEVIEGEDDDNEDRDWDNDNDSDENENDKERKEEGEKGNELEEMASNNRNRSAKKDNNRDKNRIKNKELTEHEERLFFLIGCGGVVDIGSIFNYEYFTVHVLDSVRPFNLTNLRATVSLPSVRDFEESPEINLSQPSTVLSSQRLRIWGVNEIIKEVSLFFRQVRSGAMNKKASLMAKKRVRKDKKRENSRRKASVGNDDNSGEGKDGFDGEECEDEGEEEEEEDDICETEVSEGDEGEGEDTEGRKRARRRDKLTGNDNLKAWLVDQSSVNRRQERAYYSTLSSGRSVASEVYNLAIAINQPKQDYIWHAAVGVTDLYMRRLMDYASYRLELSRLKSDLEGYKVRQANVLNDITNRFNNSLNNTVNSRFGNIKSGNVGPNAPNEVKNKLNINQRYLSGLPAAATEQVTIKPSIECKPMVLLRHWTLWSSLWHQPDVANALDLYNSDKGESVLQALLAVCGVSRKEAEKPWSSIPLTEKQRILPLLQNTLKEAIPDFFLATITRSVGYSAEVSAFDVCRMFNSIVAAAVPPELFLSPANLSSVLPFHVREGKNQQGTVTDSSNKGKGDRGGENPTQPVNPFSLLPSIHAFFRGQFWQAHRVLVISPHDAEFASGVQSAKELLQCISIIVKSLLSYRGVITSTNTLHYFVPGASGGAGGGRGADGGDRTSTQSIESMWTVPRLREFSEYLACALNYRRRLQNKPPVPLLISCPIPTKAFCAGGSSKKNDLFYDTGNGLYPYSSPSSLPFLTPDSSFSSQRFLITCVHTELCRKDVYKKISVIGYLKYCAGKMPGEDVAVMLPYDLDYVQMDNVVDNHCLTVIGKDNANHLVETIHLSLARRKI